jgi:hypothetical protein
MGMITSRIRPRMSSGVSMEQQQIRHPKTVVEMGMNEQERITTIEELKLREMQRREKAELMARCDDAYLPTFCYRIVFAVYATNGYKQADATLKAWGV